MSSFDIKNTSLIANISVISRFEFLSIEYVTVIFCAFKIILLSFISTFPSKVAILALLSIFKLSELTSIVPLFPISMEYAPTRRRLCLLREDEVMMAK